MKLRLGQRTNLSVRERLELAKPPLLQGLQAGKIQPLEPGFELLPQALGGTPLGASRWLKHWHDVGGPLQLGGDVSARLVQLQQVEASGELLGQMV